MSVCIKSVHKCQDGSQQITSTVFGIIKAPTPFQEYRYFRILCWKGEFFYDELGECVITVTVVFMLCAHVMTCEVICFCMALKT